MRALLLLVGSFLSLIAVVTSAVAQAPIHEWSMRFGGTSQDGNTAVAVDQSGNIYVTGFFSGAVNFGGGSLVSAGQFDIFLAKYNALGVHQWSKRFGSSSDDTGAAIAIDASGNAVMAGYFQGTVDFGGGPLVSAGASDFFLVKCDGNGLHKWSKRFGNLTDDWSQLGLAGDGDGNMLFAGVFQGGMDFGGGVLGNAGGHDIFLAKYDDLGAHQWSRGFGGVLEEWGSVSVDVDGYGNVILAGGFSGAANFGGGPLVSAGDLDIVLASYSAEGLHKWSKRFGGGLDDWNPDVAVDDRGDVILVGSFQSAVDFGGGSLVSAGGHDMFCAKYSSVGAHQWSRRFGGMSDDYCRAVAVDGFGDAIFTGSFQGTVDFGGGPILAGGVTDFVLAKYSTSGVHQYSRGFVESSGGFGRAVAVDAMGNVILSGDFGGSVNFGGGSLVSAGLMSDIFLARFAADAQEPVIMSIADIGNDEGRKVKIRFRRAAHDRPESPTQVWQYEAYRRDDPPPATMTSWLSPPLRSRTHLDDGWTQVGVVAAHGTSSYGIDVPTIGDSTVALGSYYSHFFIRAATATPTVYFDSPVDSGQSVDNLAPGVPGGLIYSRGTLSWNESSAQDFDYFTIYGSDTDSYAAAIVVTYSVARIVDVSNAPHLFYFVTATDFSGNEGEPARISVLTGAGGTPEAYVLSVANYPNPFNPTTTVNYTVPARGAVKVAIFDTRGTYLATLVSGTVLDAGAYRTEWNGITDSGNLVSSGIYFVRIEHGGEIRTKKMVLLK